MGYSVGWVYRLGLFWFALDRRRLGLGHEEHVPLYLVFYWAVRLILWA